MYEKILVPLDGSELAEEALPYAEKLSARLGSEVMIIHVSEFVQGPSDRIHQFYIQKIVDATRQGTEECSTRFGKGSDIRVQSEILSGIPAEKIVEYAAKEGVGLVVIATHGRSGFSRWSLGSWRTMRPFGLLRR